MTGSTSSIHSDKCIARLEHVSKSYRIGTRELEVLRGVDLEIHAHEFCALMGPSGAGKSTMLHIIGLLDLPTAGEYHFRDRNTSSFSDARLSYLRNHEIGFIFQAYNLFPRMTVQKNIEMPMIYASYPRRKRHKRACELAEHVGLSHRLGHFPNQLSGGEMQRVAIARSLACRPELVLADEPTGNLDEHTGEEIMELLKQLNSEGITIVMVTHNPELLSYVQRVVEIHDGKIQEDRVL